MDLFAIRALLTSAGDVSRSRSPASMQSPKPTGSRDRNPCCRLLSHYHCSERASSNYAPGVANKFAGVSHVSWNGLELNVWHAAGYGLYAYKITAPTHLASGWRYWEPSEGYTKTVEQCIGAWQPPLRYEPLPCIENSTEFSPDMSDQLPNRVLSRRLCRICRTMVVGTAVAADGRPAPG